MSASSTQTFEVTAADTALALGSGDVDVLATPQLLAWMEAVTVTAARPHLRPGQTSVGVEVQLRHRRPTRVGGNVTVVAEIVGQPGDRLTFAVAATDASGEVVGSGRIERAVVTRTGFG